MERVNPQTLCLVVILWCCFGAVPTETVLPCIYEGHLKTDKDWFGFLANITIMHTGRLTFEFNYPADKCCQNVLFYLKEQMAVLNSRMNCWQKEALLRPENDQVLRLTPRFTWSGCHMSHPNGISTYVCAGGRSFTSIGSNNKPTTWYIAISNCASLMGLELYYKIQVIGHIGECKSPYKIVTTPLYPHAVNVIQDGSQTMGTLIGNNNCVLEGELNTTDTWHGYIANVSLAPAGGFRFKLSYPYQKQVQNVILYNQEDVDKIQPQHSCWQKEGVIRQRHVPDQILDLSFRSSWNGCVTKNTTSVLLLVCQGERHFNSKRKLFLAVNNCRSRSGLTLKYRFEFFGYEGNPCSGSSSILQDNTRTSATLLNLAFSVIVSFVLYCNLPFR